MDIVEDLRTTVRSSNPDFFQKAADEIEQLRAALLIAVTQNEHDMLLTGEELRVCRRALTPNAALTGAEGVRAEGAVIRGDGK